MQQIVCSQSIQSRHELDSFNVALSSQTRSQDRFKPLLVWPLLEDGMRVMMRRGHTEACHLEEARFRTTGGYGLWWLQAAKYVCSAGGQERTHRERERGRQSLAYGSG
jgi:hypothetical protein